MFDPSYPELLSSYQDSSHRSSLVNTARASFGPPPILANMSFAFLKTVFSQRYTRLSVKNAAEVQEKQFDLESSSDISDSSTLRPNNKYPAFRPDSRVVSDAIIGLSDGLTVPFALTAGLSALGDTKVVIYGGLAELIAGAISMGLGGYLGAKSEE